MSKSSRDDFTEGVKRTVAERGAYICANPSCRRPTVGPHSDPSKSLKTGKACHIRAAASGGPRYDPKQITEERKGIENAIWLCSECSDVVDKDESSYPPELLLEWKGNHETWLRDDGIVPALPNISLWTMKGFTVPEVPGKITGQDLEGAREHRFKIANGSDVEIRNIEAHIQLPDPIIASFGCEKPAGVSVAWTAIRPQMQAIIKGGGSVTRNRPPLPTNVYKFQVDRIAPSRAIELGFITSTKIH